MSNSEIKSLPTAVRKTVRAAIAQCARAETLFDLGVARGLLLGLHKMELLNRSDLDRAFKRAHLKLKPKLGRRIRSLPSEVQAHYGKGIVVPAAKSTRAHRK